MINNDLQILSDLQTETRTEYDKLNAQIEIDKLNRRNELNIDFTISDDESIKMIDRIYKLQTRLNFLSNLYEKIINERNKQKEGGKNDE